MRNFLLLVLGVLLMAGCGRKEPPQAIVDAAPPAIEAIKIIDADPSKKLEIQLTGGAGGVGYQIERAEMDPYCKCPAVWRRYYEEPPLERNNSRVLPKMIRMQVVGNDFVYRLRAIDAAGRLGSWHKLSLTNSAK
ncbi:MAG: hypothetical protein JKY80_01405 [Mariprofundaceae bacterium]|nr:hypothetical protein [Mariprofundaceae bacterium]MBN4061293.1 hypothetical protein [bacterium AH-315-G11]